MRNLAGLNRFRFNEAEQRAKERAWKILCEPFFQRFIDPSSTLLEIACGNGEFTRNIRAASKKAIDLNPESRERVDRDVEFHLTSVDKMDAIASETVDVFFTSNFFEHLSNKLVMDAVLAEAFRVLKPGGRFIMMQPNIENCASDYWDFYDHHLPLSHLSASEALATKGYEIALVIPKFMPYSTKSALPK